MSRFTRLLLAFWLAFSGVADAARTVAVLPLEKAAASEEYDGLGLALAGMMTTDLSEVEALQLVERSRLDAILSEIELGNEGYLDKNTAAKVGKGVGAELVVVGSYSVVAETFLLDARFVDVEKGTVVQAADAQGSVGDFVSVEKDVIDALIDKMQIEVSGSERRRIIGSAPTESFDAFQDYGGGLAAEQRGEFEAAKERFETAVSKDPEFEAAKGALAGLRGRLEAIDAADRSKQLTAAEQRLMNGLEAAPDARELKKIPTDLKSTARFALRWQALNKLERHCQRYEEMLAYGKGVGWKIDYPKGKPSRPIKTKAPLLTEIIIQAEDTGMIVGPDRYDTYPMSDGTGVTRTSNIFKNAGEFSIGYTQSEPWRETRTDMLRSLLACYPRGEQAARIGELGQAIVAAGQGSLLVDETTYNIPLDERFIVLEAHVEARNSGVSEEIRRQLDALLDKYPEDDRANELYPHTWMKNAVDKVIRAGEQAASTRRVMMGMTQAQFIAAWNALIDPAGTAPLLTARPYCKFAVEDSRKRMKNWSRAPTPMVPAEIERRAFSDGQELARLVDFGCIDGIAAKVHSVEEAFGMVAAGIERVDPEHQAGPFKCKQNLPSVQGSLNSYMGALSHYTEEQQFNAASSVLQLYYTMLVFQGCVR